MSHLAEELLKLYGGRPDVYAVGKAETDKDGKPITKATEHGYLPLKYTPSVLSAERVKNPRPMTAEHLEAHLEGKSQFPIGSYVQRDDGRCRFFAIDLDFFDKKNRKPTKEESDQLLQWANDLKTRADAIAGVKLFLVRSRSGAGIHAYGFCKEWLPGRLIRAAMLRVIKDSKVPHMAPKKSSGWDAIFPKQDMPPDIGNLLGLPFHGYYKDECVSVAIDHEKNLEEWVEHADVGRCSEAELLALAPDDYKEDAPEKKLTQTSQKFKDPLHESFDDKLDQEYEGEKVYAPKVMVGRMTSYCAVIRNAVENGCGYEDWLALASWLKEFEGGYEIFHAISKLDAENYTRENADAKWTEAQKLGPFNCNTVWDQHGQTCKERFNLDYQCVVTNPVQLKSLNFEISDVELDHIRKGNADGTPFTPEELEKEIKWMIYYVAKKQLINKPTGRHVLDKMKNLYPGHKLLSRDLNKLVKDEAKIKHEGKDGEPQLIRGEVSEYNQDKFAYYYVNFQGLPMAISNFVFVPKEIVNFIDDQDFEINCDALMNNGKIIHNMRLTSDTFTSKQSLKKAIKPIELKFTGTDDQTQGLKVLICDKIVNKKRGVRVLGLHDGLIVLSKQVLSKDGDITDKTDIQFAGTDNPLANVWERFPPPKDGGNIKRICELLPQINEQRTIMALYGWIAASFMKPVFLEKFNQFPHAFVYGLRGSGKTSFISKMMELFGASKVFSEDVHSTRFVAVKLPSSTNNLFVFYDEYKRGLTNRRELEAFHKMLNRSYNPTFDRRGVITQAIKSYEKTIPMIVAGESSPTEKSILERCVFSMFTKINVGEEKYSQPWEELCNLDFSGFAYEFIHILLNSDFDEVYDKAKATVSEGYKGSGVKLPRYLYNLKCVEFGLEILRRLFEKYEVELEVDRAAVYNAQEKEVFTGSGSVEQPLDQFLRILSIMSALGQVNEGTHYKRDSETTILISLRVAHAVYAEFLNKTRIEDEIFQEHILRKNAEELTRTPSYVLDANRRAIIGNSRRQCILIDESAMAKLAAIEPYGEKEKKEEREYYGDRYQK